jgi:hypothetical protein
MASYSTVSINHKMSQRLDVLSKRYKLPKVQVLDKALKKLEEENYSDSDSFHKEWDELAKKMHLPQNKRIKLNITDYDIYSAAYR